MQNDEGKSWRFWIGALVVGILLVLYYHLVTVESTTSFDYRSYIEQLEVVLIDGELNYTNVVGTTGPIMYPAGHLIAYWIIHSLIADPDPEVYAIAEYPMILFGVMLVIMSVIVSLCYKATQETTEIPSWTVLRLLASVRVLNIFILGFFNDCVAMLFLHLSIYLMVKGRWTWACVVFSIAVSIKMNILLFAPGLLLLLIQLNNGKVIPTCRYLLVCAIVQVVIGFPFLITYPLEYISSSFNFGRAFVRKRSVNFRFLPISVFESKVFSIGLLGCHLSTLIYFFVTKIYKTFPPFKEIQTRAKESIIPASYILDVMYCSNFIGVCFARSLHYQFFSWYFHTLPYLLFRITQWPMILRTVLFFAVVFSWEKHPPNEYSSIILTISHLMILFGLARSPSLFVFDNKIS